MSPTRVAVRRVMGSEPSRLVAFQFILVKARISVASVSGLDSVDCSRIPIGFGM
jgi:hypothetical protein